MQVTIYKYNTIEIRAVIDPNDQSQQERQIMGVDTITITFSDKDVIDFQIGDYATIFGVIYKVNILPTVTKIAKKDYDYTVVMESEMYDLTKVQYLFLNASNIFTEGKFSLRGKPQDFCDLIVFNLRRLYPDAGWKLGYVIDSDFISLDFDSQNCLEVLSTLADTFTTEYLVQDRTINLYKKQVVNGITLQYGKDNPLYGLTRQNTDNSNVITRLYAFGSNKNIGSNYRNGAQYLRMADSLYIEKHTDKYGIIEGTKNFDGSDGTIEIYPHRTGNVSNVTSPLVFSDSTMDFDVNDYLLEDGTTAKVTFNTGLLAGYTFEIHSYDTLTKTFTINVNKDETTITVPSDDRPPAVGDEYVITDIRQPLAYVNAAESLLRDEAQKYLNTYSTPQLTYTVVCNSLYFKKNATNVDIAQTVGIIDDALGINRQIRITAFTRNLRKPYLYTMTLSDTVKAQSTIVKLINGI